MTAQQLKNSILQMAVQGKLVPQDPDDEPASVLLDRIRAEKEQLSKSGKIKKEKNSSVIFRGEDNLPYEKVGDSKPICIADEVPFEIPDSWAWARLEDLCEYIQRGKSPKYSPIKKYPVVAQKCNQWSGFSIEKAKFIDPDTLKSYGKERILQDKDLMWNSTGLGTLGRMAIYQENLNPYELAVADSHVTVIRPLKNFIVVEYLYFYFSSPSVQLIIEELAEGSTKQKELATITIKKYLVPVPPRAEQQRIVEKIETLTPYIDNYNDQYESLEILNNRFPDNFKKSILQQAIQGKLVPQDSADEPASVLLERIRAEKEQMIKDGKIKRDKHESIIYRKDNSFYEKIDGVERCIDDEIPFEIPDSWRWCRLKSVVNIVSARRVHQSDWQTRGIPFYRAREIAKLAENGYVENELFISEKLYNEYKKSGVPQPGDLMVTAVGTLGKTYVVRPNDRFYYKDASVICFENFGKLSPLYVQLVMQTPYIEKIIAGNSSGTTVGTITIVKANEYLTPIPPFPEQERIVEKVERLLSKIKEI